MKKRAQTPPTDPVEPHILTLRGQKVILDSDLARIYGVETKTLNRAVIRNAKRFPADFLFKVTREEVTNLRYQFGTSSSGYGGRRYLPHAFTETGAVMAANVLSSQEAVRMSVFVVRAFIRMRELLVDHKALAEKLAELDARVGDHDQQLAAIIQAIRQLAAPDGPSTAAGSASISSLQLPSREHRAGNRAGHQPPFLRGNAPGARLAGNPTRRPLGADRRFKGQIKSSEREKADGLRPRTR